MRLPQEELRMRKNLSLLITGLALLAMLAVPAMAQEEFATIKEVPAGFDVWQTVGFGATGYGFADDPIPKDFFCFGSEPFKGRINFEGVPVKTDPANYLGQTDTIIERLDDAVFDDNGLAKTRIQIRALSLAGMSTIKNSCGAFSTNNVIRRKRATRGEVGRVGALGEPLRGG
jgi:hypothetical protein